MFYISNKQLSTLSGKGLARITHLVQGDTDFPYRLDGKDRFYDVDNQTVNDFIQKRPATNSESVKAKIAAAEFLRVEFDRQRREGAIKCHFGGTPESEDNFMGFYPEPTQHLPVSRAIDEPDENVSKDTKKLELLDLDILKRREEVVKLELINLEKKGTSISRDLVRKYIEEYIGILHKNHIDLPGTGVAGDIYAVAHRLEGREAVKEIEKVLGKALAGLLSDSQDMLRSNPL